MARTAAPNAPEAPLWLRTAAAAVRMRLGEEWRSTPLYEAAIARPQAAGTIASPRDFRPPDAALGEAVLEGRFPFFGEVLEVGAGGEPWDRPSPSRRHAVQLHRFAWLPSLLAQGVGAQREALRLILAWRELFDRPAPFAWGPEALERRVFNLACGLSAVRVPASEAEAEALTQSLARQARGLAGLDGGPARRAERWAATATAGCALAGVAGDRLLDRALPRLSRALDFVVLGDGGLRTRSPEQAMELWFDLATLDDALLQRGRATPAALAGALDRLAGAVRFFTLPDGRLAAFQGGGGSTPVRVAAARPEDAPTGVSPYASAPHSGFHRLEGRRLTLMVDAGAPAPNGWGVAACAQPCAFEVVAAGEPLIVGGGWTPDAAAPDTLRLAAAASTLALGDASPGRPLTGLAARVLGPRLRGAPPLVEARRETAEAGVLLELSHDGWAPEFGLTHLRRLFLDVHRDELRGEDRLTATDPGRRPRDARAVARFHLAPGVRASVARDGRSVLLRGPSDLGWWFRNDAAAVRIEPSVRVQEGVARPGLQIALGLAVSPEGARVRWKLSPVEAARPTQAAPAPPGTPSPRTPSPEVPA